MIDGTITGTTTPGQGRPGSNGNEEVFHSTLSSRTRVLPPDTAQCHIPFS